MQILYHAYYNKRDLLIYLIKNTYFKCQFCCKKLKKGPIKLSYKMNVSNYFRKACNEKFNLKKNKDLKVATLGL